MPTDSEVRRALARALRSAAAALELDSAAAEIVTDSVEHVDRIDSPAPAGLRQVKRERVMTLLADPSAAQWSSRELARRAGVGCAFVEKIRREFGAAPVKRLFVREGAIRTMNTARIGR